MVRRRTPNGCRRLVRAQSTTGRRRSVASAIGALRRVLATTGLTRGNSAAGGTAVLASPGFHVVLAVASRLLAFSGLKALLKEPIAILAQIGMAPRRVSC